MRIHFRGCTFLGLGLLFWLVSHQSVMAQSEIKLPTMEDYFQLTISMQELSVQEWTERLEIASNNQGSRLELADAFQTVLTKYQQRREQVMKEAGFGARLYLDYSSVYRAEMESYLEEHEEIQVQIKGLRSQINGLIQQVEAVASNREGGVRRSPRNPTTRTQLPGRIINPASPR